MTKWPKYLPLDLRHRLEGVMGARSFGPADVYAAFAEWCEEHGVEPPGLPPEPELPSMPGAYGPAN